MKVCILYHPESEFSRHIEEYATDFERQHNKKIELVSLETREGAATASLYDIVQYPTMMVLSDDGQIRKAWEGPQLPLTNEVMGYLNS